MPSLRILNASGDTRLSWDHDALQRGDPEALAAVREAERIFAEARAAGGEAFRLRAGQVAERVERFAPGADDDVVIIPRMVGG